MGEEMQREAIFDPTQTYRYWLGRSWNREQPRVGFVMLNPSRADAEVDDPTIRRCIGFARCWGYGGLEVMNLFAYRTAHPRELKQAADPIGPDTDRYLSSLLSRVDRVVLAWGNWGSLGGRHQGVVPLLHDRRRVYCLGITQQGQPKHPLYLRQDTPLQPLTLVERPSVTLPQMNGGRGQR